MFINDRLGVIESELGNVDSDISDYKSEHLIPDVGAVASMYMSQAQEAQAGIKDLNNQLYMARYIRNYLSNAANSNQALPVSSGVQSLNVSSEISAYNTALAERNSLVAASSEANPLVQEMDRNLAGPSLCAPFVDRQPDSCSQRPNSHSPKFVRPGHCANCV